MAPATGFARIAVGIVQGCQGLQVVEIAGIHISCEDWTKDLIRKRTALSLVELDNSLYFRGGSGARQT